MSGKTLAVLLFFAPVLLLIVISYYYDLFRQVPIYIESLNRWQIIDLVSQALIFFMGVGAILMISCFKNKWGNVVGLVHQPFWYFTTLYHGQWGLFLMSLVHTIAWSIGIWQWFYKNKPLLEN